MARIERRLVLYSFLFVIILTAIAGVLVNLGLFPKADPSFGKWVYGALVAEILGAVIWFFRTPSKEPTSMFVNIVFPGKDNIELDVDRCYYEVRDANNQAKSDGSILPHIGPGGWQCRLPSDVEPHDYIKLRLTDTDGVDWEVGYFIPYVTTQEATRRG